MSETTTWAHSTIKVDDDIVFQLYAISEDDLDIGLAVYAGEEAASVRDIVSAVGGDAFTSIVALLPTSLEVMLKQVLYASLTDNASGKTAYLFSFALGTGLDLAELSPLLAQVLPSEEMLSVDTLEIYVTAGEISASQVQVLNSAIQNLNELGEAPIEITALPERDLESGLSFGCTVWLAGRQYLFGLPAMAPEEDEASEPDDADANATDNADADAADEPEPAQLTLIAEDPTYTLWYELQKSFGAAEFARLGMRYTSNDNALWFLLDATLKTSSMELSLQELAFGSSLLKFDPGFSLAGIGLDYSSPSLTLSGQFQPVTNDDGEIDSYEGGVIVKTKTFSLAALGAFGKVEGHPSLFIYGVLDKPIGGPAFFFVEGLAAGLGYNRALTTPAIEDIPDFPLVTAAITPPAEIDLAGTLESLHDYLTPSVGAQFYAFGVKFNTFKLVDSFALFIALIDDDAWKLKLLGYSTLIAPVPKDGESKDALAYLELALDGTIDPGEGLMGIQGQLTPNSYVFSKDCKVTGGFAFYAWFDGEHAGDFVQTIGGYHPDFDVPSHYPTVPRLALDWRIDSSLSVEGELYFALTPRLLMAGGYLKATWKQSGIEAWFKAGADFLVCWQPYSYSIRIKVDVGASAKIKVKLGFATVHKKITIHVGAQLDLWGPKFAGKAKIKASLLSFTISFGSAKSKIEPLSWREFQKAFLPSSTSVCSIQALGGLQSTFMNADGVEQWAMVGKDLRLQIDSQVPANAAQLWSVDDSGAPALLHEFTTTGDDAEIANLPTFGLAPMDISGSGDEAVNARFVVTITHNNEDIAADDFKLTPLRKNLPAGVWGTRFSASLNDARMIENAFAGFIIEPGSAVAPYQSVAIPTDSLAVEAHTITSVYTWDDATLAPVESWDEEVVLAAIPAGDAAGDAFTDNAANLVAAIFNDLDPVVMDFYDPSIYRVTPQVEQLITTAA